MIQKDKVWRLFIKASPWLILFIVFATSQYSYQFLTSESRQVAIYTLVILFTVFIITYHLWFRKTNIEKTALQKSFEYYRPIIEKSNNPLYFISEKKFKLVSWIISAPFLFFVLSVVILRPLGVHNWDVIGAIGFGFMILFAALVSLVLLCYAGWKKLSILAFVVAIMGALGFTYAKQLPEPLNFVAIGLFFLGVLAITGLLLFSFMAYHRYLGPGQLYQKMKKQHTNLNQEK